MFHLQYHFILACLQKSYLFIEFSLSSLILVYTTHLYLFLWSTLLSSLRCSNILINIPLNPWSGIFLRLFALGSTIIGFVNLRGYIVLDFRAAPCFVLGLAHLESVGWVVVLALGCWSRDCLPISLGTRESGEVRE